MADDASEAIELLKHLASGVVDLAGIDRLQKFIWDNLELSKDPKIEILYDLAYDLEYTLFDPNSGKPAFDESRARVEIGLALLELEKTSEKKHGSRLSPRRG